MSVLFESFHIQDMVWMWDPGGDVEANRELRERAQRRDDDDDK
jgi:hypothetical protein